jgi:hypothetical protein
MTKELYYIQDTSTIVSNSALWWKRNGKGYTTDLNEAWVVSREEAYSQYKNDDTAIPRLKYEIDRLSRYHFDVQDINRLTPHDFNLPEYVTVGGVDGCCLALKGRSYYRHGGAWGVEYELKNGVIYVISEHSHLNGLVLIETTEDKWRVDNGKYAPPIDWKETIKYEDGDDIPF